MNLRQRDFRRDVRDRMRDLAWVFIASPVLVVALGRGRYSVWEAAFMPVVGILMLLWFRRHPTVPEHVAAVELVRPDDYHGPGAKLDSFFLAWCDCGWSGDDQRDEQAARTEASQHTSHVRSGLHAWGE
jgi:hypothetical protein